MRSPYRSGGEGDCKDSKASTDGEHGEGDREKDSVKGEDAGDGDGDDEEGLDLNLDDDLAEQEEEAKHGGGDDSDAGRKEEPHEVGGIPRCCFFHRACTSPSRWKVRSEYLARLADLAPGGAPMTPVNEWGTASVLTPHMRCAVRPRKRCARGRRAWKKRNEAGVLE